MNFTGHFRTITKHKMLVMRHCFAMGLYRQGLTHDLSKYMPSEFLVGAKYYQGTRSPNNAEREHRGYSGAWLHHKGRNKHHFEYWIDYSLEDPDRAMAGMRMPRKYVAEMLADRVAACKVYGGDAYTQHEPLRYFLKGKNRYMMHPKTMRELEFFLRYLDRYGEEACFRYVKYVYLKKVPRRFAGKMACAAAQIRGVSRDS